MIVESGHSATYCVPFFNDEILNYAVKKLDVGGRLFTNHLKDILSFRYMNL